MLRRHHSQIVVHALLMSLGGWLISPPSALAQPQPAPAASAGPAAPDVVGAPAAAPPVAASPGPTPEATTPPTTTGPAAPEASTGAAGAGAAGWGDISTLSDSAATPIFRTKIYGFIDSYLEKVADTPEGVSPSGQSIYEEQPYEFDVLNLHLMVQGSIYDRYRYFVNLASPGSGSTVEDASVLVRNAWVEAPLISGFLNLRAGKLYRRFGLYNEILDAVPTFIGIEPPELFDKDHLMLTRTTNLMLHGSADLGSAVLNYALTTGNDERGSKSVPLGADVHLEFPFGLKIGSSFYTTGGDAKPSRGVGDGPGAGGVANWMTKDKFYVTGGYAQLKKSGWILQAEYWRAPHDATRDIDSVKKLGTIGHLNPAQLRRFFVNGDPNGQVYDAVKYTVETYYMRAGYEIAVGERSSITPYAQADFYRNLETVHEKSLGGDHEAGLSDNGQFQKYTVGGVFRPVPQVALKIDGSGHVQKFNGESVFYPEVRTSFSYLWELSL